MDNEGNKTSKTKANLIKELNASLKQNSDNSQTPNNKSWNKHNFTEENKIEKVNFNQNKNYFEYDSKDTKRYEFMSIKTFFYSKQMLKAFSWSFAIGTIFYFHRYYRTKNLINAIRWGTGSMFGSFLFIWGSLEFQPFVNGYFHIKQGESKMKYQLNNEFTKRYHNRVLKNTAKNTQQQQFIASSDYYAIFALNTINIQLKFFNTFEERSSFPLDLNDYFKVRLKYNPFAKELSSKQIELNIDDELGIEDEDEFYINEINKEADLLKNYQIVAIWMDYDKLGKHFGDLVPINKEYLLALHQKYKHLLESKDNDTLTARESELKELLINNIFNDIYKLKLPSSSSNNEETNSKENTKNQVNIKEQRKNTATDNLFYPNISDEEYRKNALKNAKLVLNNYHLDSKKLEDLLIKEDKFNITLRKV